MLSGQLPILFRLYAFILLCYSLASALLYLNYLNFNMQCNLTCFVIVPGCCVQLLCVVILMWFFFFPPSSFSSPLFLLRHNHWVGVSHPRAPSGWLRGSRSCASCRLGAWKLPPIFPAVQESTTYGSLPHRQICGAWEEVSTEGYSQNVSTNNKAALNSFRSVCIF